MDVIGLLVGKLTKNGQRARAEKIVLEAIHELKGVHGAKNPLEVVFIALQRLAPLVEIKSKKVGGTVYRIPKDVSEERAMALGIRWLLDSVEESKGASFSKRLAKELFLAYTGEGKGVERVRELHAFARKNRGLVKFL